MRKFAVVSKGDCTSDAFKLLFEERLQKNDFILDELNPHVVIFVGGDGTMLEAFHRYKHIIDNVSFVGLHTGHLGFYADWKREEIDTFINYLIHRNPRVVQYPLVEMNINGTVHYALNEVTIKNATKTFISDIYINDHHFEQFRGDGLCISTPSGSTAYNKSLGGAIVHPFLECMQLSEMASINNRSFRTLGSSVIVPKEHKIHIKCKNNSDQLTLICDHLQQSINGEEEFDAVFSVSSKKVSFLRYREFPFWNRVKTAFIE